MHELKLLFSAPLLPSLRRPLASTVHMVGGCMDGLARGQASLYPGRRYRQPAFATSRGASNMQGPGSGAVSLLS